MKGMIHGGNHLSIKRSVIQVKRVDFFFSLDLIDESIPQKDGCSRNMTPVSELMELVNTLHPINQTIIHFSTETSVIPKLMHISNCVSMANYEAFGNKKMYSHILFVRPEVYLESILPPNEVWWAMSKTAAFAIIPSYFAPYHSCPNMQLFSLGYTLAQSYLGVTHSDVETAIVNCLTYGRSFVHFPNWVHKKNKTCYLPECKIEHIGFNISGLWSPLPFPIQWSMKRNSQVGLCPPGSENDVKDIWKQQGSKSLEG